MRTLILKRRWYEKNMLVVNLSTETEKNKFQQFPIIAPHSFLCYPFSTK